MRGGFIRTYTDIQPGTPGFQPIHVAAQNGTPEDIRRLITEGADVNQKTRYDSWTPLTIAAAKGRLNIVNALLEAPDIQVNLAARTDNGTPLYVAIVFNTYPIVERLLEDPRIDVNKGLFGESPLSSAINEGSSLRIIEKLLNHPAMDVNKADNQQFPLYNAIINTSNEYVLRLLLQSPRVDVNKVGPFNQTALAAAIYKDINRERYMFGETYFTQILIDNPHIDLMHPSVLQAIRDIPRNSTILQMLKNKFRSRDLPLDVFGTTGTLDRNNRSVTTTSNHNTRYNSSNHNNNNNNHVANYYKNIGFTNELQVPNNAKNAIYYTNIQPGNKLISFHNEETHGRYYTKNTFNRLQSRNDGIKKNPFTRRNILRNNVKGYIAKK